MSIWVTIGWYPVPAVPVPATCMSVAALNSLEANGCALVPMTVMPAFFSSCAYKSPSVLAAGAVLASGFTSSTFRSFTPLNRSTRS